MAGAVYPLFPCPLLVCGERYEFSAREKSFIAELTLLNNVGNSISENDKVLDSEELADLRTFVDGQLLNFKKNLLSIKDENEIYVTQSWVNSSAADQFHPQHKHPNSIISGVLFLDDNTDARLPPIRFHRSQDMFPLSFSFDELNEFNADCREFDPEQGMLMLFPSFVEHDVAKNTSGRVRTSLSFNTYVRGTVGGRDQLTEVSIS